MHEVFKRYGLIQFANTSLIASNIGFYMLPIFYCFYIQCRYKEVFIQWDTPYSNIAYLELNIFISWVLASILFMFLAYTFKYRATWQQIDISKSIWKMKDSNDFLKYLRFEYKIFCLIFTVPFHDLLFYIQCVNPTFAE